MAGGLEQQTQTFAQHLQELRRRLLVPFLVILTVGVFAFYNSDSIVSLLQKPLNKTIYYSSPAGGFSFIFQIAVFCGLIFSLPVFIHQLIKFLKPVMKAVTKRTLSLYLASSAALALLGVACGYLISLPAALHFLSSFESDAVQALISADQYLKFVMIYLAGFAIVFQLPLVILVINRIRPLGPGSLRRYQKHVLVASFVVAAILTPTPDVLNQVIFAMPMILLYEISIWLVRFVNRTHKQPAKIPVPAVTSYEVPDLIPIPLNYLDIGGLKPVEIEPKPLELVNVHQTGGFDIIRPGLAGASV